MGVEKLVVDRAQARGLIPLNAMVNETIGMRGGDQLIYWTDPATHETFNTLMPLDHSTPTLATIEGSEDTGANVRLEYTFSLAWGKLGIDCKDELECRAMLLIRDRLKEWTTQEPQVTIHQGNIKVKFSCDLNKARDASAKLAAVREEVRVLPQTGTAACPCGCGADLALRECRRQRVAVKEGVVCLTPPAFAARDQAYPDHQDHGIVGWAVDLVVNGVIMACTCGAVLRVPYETAQEAWSDESIAPGGPAAKIIQEAIVRFYAQQRSNAPGDSLVGPYHERYIQPSPFQRQMERERERMQRLFLKQDIDDQVEALKYSHGMGAEEFKTALLAGPVDLAVGDSIEVKVKVKKP
jgi:hypothetical protein